ncbi:MAG: redoxin domain-containing protein [Anaerolineales bacterium]|nr:MAG: redoxin domain-containing protein [Anaerolineales bacterium]
MDARAALGQAAPDFGLQDTEGRVVRLSDFLGSRNVVVILTRGFL